MEPDETKRIAARMKAAAYDAGLQRTRYELAKFAARMLVDSGRELHVVGHFFGLDRVEGESKTGNGDDETVAAVSYTHLTLPTIYSV